MLSMASTLSLLKFSVLPKNPHQLFSTPKIHQLPSSISARLNTPKDPPKATQFLEQHSISNALKTVPLTLTALTFPFLLEQKDAALAVDGEFGILEGRTFALIHPIVMISLFFFTLWTGYLGWQWRRVRTIQEEINELKKQVKSTPVTPEGKPVEGAEAPSSSVELKIQQLTEERKGLLKGSYRDRHYNAGSILLGFGVLEAVGGGLNTWIRTGKLFPGPHLFAGTAITVLWALSAALVPSMQKGSELARSLHITFNTLNVLLFISQLPTGFEILMKVFEFTQWP
ncbi:hypothetical protein HN51_046398 [Arachis hypogaea]|uniref:uncharacterized protein LOC107623938 n=1 Tax=Arachis ipaensis TaxID=130454 RepID=UPI0007AF461C|nr:uncharacterized protein LOC107623938 [Arachis ipaensis]XP_025631755.1 uncharacterized protein LOC112726545 [Arachis hypogaea]QHO22545.1 uncharacterized protein DS421_12g356180 [Arachis hypogaea]